VLDNGKLKCWGEAAAGQLGSGDRENRGDQPGEMGDKLPEVNLGAGRTAVSVAAGGQATCVILDTGGVKCFGESHFGIGYGTRDGVGTLPGQMGDNLPEVDLCKPTAKAVELAAGDHHMCARFDDGSVKCWGHNGMAQLGLGDTTSRGDDSGEMGCALPEVQLCGRSAVQIGAGVMHTCAVLDDGSLRCWGQNDRGQAGVQPKGGLIGGAPGEMGCGLQPIDLGDTTRCPTPAPAPAPAPGDVESMPPSQSAALDAATLALPGLVGQSSKQGGVPGGSAPASATSVAASLAGVLAAVGAFWSFALRPRRSIQRRCLQCTVGEDVDSADASSLMGGERGDLGHESEGPSRAYTTPA